MTKQPRGDRVLVFRIDAACPPVSRRLIRIRGTAVPFDASATLTFRLQAAAERSIDYDVNAVFLDGHRAVIDLDLSGEGSTSTVTANAYALLATVAFQFPAISEMEPRYNGSCRGFAAWAEGTRCVVIDRGSWPGP